MIDENGAPAQAKVQFQLFNFGGLRPILKMDTDENGIVEASVGLGDIYVCAAGAKGWAFAKYEVNKADELTLTLTKELQDEGELSFKMVPPSDRNDDSSISITAEERAQHDERVKEGAAIRASYEATFLTEADAEKLAVECSLPAARVWKVLQPARGNSQEIAAFLREAVTEYGEWSLRLLEVLNEKDLTDTFRPTLHEHLAML